MTDQKLLDVRDASVQFADRYDRRLTLRAVDGVSIQVAKGRSLGIVGESGSGKTTLARAVAGVRALTSGAIVLAGKALAFPRAPSDRRRIQLVFQDPYSSLNPRLTIGRVIGELVQIHHLRAKDAVDKRVAELLGTVGLDQRFADAYPRQLSGGQRQRASIARALSVEPELLVADEPVSALDVSVQATILNLLVDLRASFGLTLVLISHDLGVIRYACDDVAVMYLGRVVETGPVDEVLRDPRHPYTKGLLASRPGFLARREERPGVEGELPSPYEIPSGCRFRTRCPIAQEICARLDPDLTEGRPQHSAACHFAWDNAAKASAGIAGVAGVGG